MNPATPDTQSYLILWLVIFAMITLIWLGSLYTRWQNLRKEENILRQIAKKEEPEIS